MILNCRRCGNEFDTDRDHPAGKHASTTRCPKCGADHDVDETDTAANSGNVLEDLPIDTDGQEIHIHVHRD